MRPVFGHFRCRAPARGLSPTAILYVSVSEMVRSRVGGVPADDWTRGREPGCGLLRLFQQCAGVETADSSLAQPARSAERPGKARSRRGLRRLSRIGGDASLSLAGKTTRFNATG